MNSKLGKLAILAGFAGLTLISCVYFLMVAFPSLSASVLSMGFIKFLNICQSLCWLAIAGGFGITFLAEHNIVDLLIAGGFGVYALYSFLTASAIFTQVKPVLISLILTVVTLLWVYKLWQKNRIAAMAVAAGVLISFTTGLFSRLFYGEFLVSIVFLVSVAEHAAMAFAAYLDMQ